MRQHKGMMLLPVFRSVTSCTRQRAIGRRRTQPPHSSMCAATRCALQLHDCSAGGTTAAAAPHREVAPGHHAVEHVHREAQPRRPREALALHIPLRTGRGTQSTQALHVALVRQWHAGDAAAAASPWRRLAAHPGGGVHDVVHDGDHVGEAEQRARQVVRPAVQGVLPLVVLLTPNTALPDCAAAFWCRREGGSQTIASKVDAPRG
jgi:hypothetical protein